MFTSGNKQALGVLAVTIIGGGLVGLGLTFGNPTIGQNVPFFTKSGQNITISPPGSLLDVDTFTQGGGRRATSTDDTTATFLATDFDVENLIEFTPNVAGITASLPATSTLASFIPNAGDNRSLAICNATSTAATPFTLALGTGMNEHNATSTLAIGTGQCAQLNMFRAGDTDIEVFVGVGQ